jgi:gliding motility-associated-like protein
MRKILLSLLLMGTSLVGVAQAPTITSFTPAYGSVGTLVTITGTNLTSPTIFNIGGANAIIISNTGSSLVGMVMPGAITGTVSLSTAGGTATSSSNFTVMPTPGPNTQQGNKLIGTGYVSSTQEPYMGYAVAISANGNTAVVSGYNDNEGQGAVWIYTRSGGIWTQQGNKLVGTGNTANPAAQGNSVSISADGNTVLVGGFNDNNYMGAAWVFVRNGNTWSQQGNKLLGTGTVGNASQGCSVSLSADGNTAAIGGYSDNTNTGAVWVFTRNSGAWTQQGSKLVGTGNVSAGGQGNVVALSADGTTLIEAAPADNNLFGAAWVFTRSGNTWTQQGSKLVATGNIGVSPFIGASIAISANGNTAIIGGYEDNNSQGATWVFTRSGTTWAQQAKLVGTGNIGQAYQGSSASLSADGNTAAVSGPGDNGNTGAFWIFKRTGITWAQQGGKQSGTGVIGFPIQGQSISLSADGYTVIEGGYEDNTAIGAAWVFNYISDNADLSSLTLSSGTLAPVFDAGTITYTASVGSAVSSITVTSVLADASATMAIQVNGGGFTTVTSGTASSALALSAGSNIIQVKVTAPDGTTTKIYSITVSRLVDQTITFAALANRTYGDVPFTLTATGGASGNTVTYTSSNTAVATVSGNTVTIIAAGNTNIKASQAGNTSYNAATDVIQALVVNPKAITVTADPKSKTYGDVDPALTYTHTPALVGTDNFTGALNRTAGENIGTHAINQNTLALSANYVLNYTSADLTINTKTITVTADPKSKTYGDVDPALTYTHTPALVGTDNFTGALNRTAGENIGTHAINQNTLALSTNYVLNYVTADLSIDTKTITVTADPKSKTYGDVDPALTYTFTPALVGTDNFTGALNRTAGENVGTHAINQNTLALSTNYVLNYATADLSIDTKTITVTADPKNKTYGDVDPALTYTFTPALVGTDNFTGALNRTAGENVGTHAINQNTLVLSTNYVLSYVSADLTIDTKTITVTADPKSKTYGDTDPALTYTFTPALIGTDNFTGTLNRTAGENVGTHAINQNTLALSTNYILNYVTADLSIDTKTITVTADPKSKTYGDADPALTYTFTPALVGTDNFTGALDRTAGENVGTHVINQNTLALSTNYVLNYVNADLSIDTKTITVTTDPKNKTYGDVDPALTYTFTPALVGTDNFTGALNRTAGENVGTHAINQNTLALSTNYVLNYINADLTIGIKTITVTADPKNKTYGSTDPALTYTYTPSLVGADNFTGALNRTAGENVGTHAINQNTLALSTNYILNYASADLTIGIKTITVTADPKSKTYGDVDPALTYTFTPALVGTDNFTGTLNRTAGENIGTHAINQNTLALNSNYILNYTSADLTIGKKILTITADNKSRLFGVANPAFTATYTGFTGTDDVTVLTAPVTFATTADINSAAGSYPIIINGATALNYDIRFTNGMLSINAITQSINFSALADKLSTDPIFTLTATAISGLAISYTSSNPAIARIVNDNQVEILKGGTVIITARQDGNVNYTAATPVSQQLTINDNSDPVIVINSNKGTAVNKGEVAILTASGAATYEWATANGIVSGQNTATLTVRPSVTTTYTVTGTSQYGSSSTQTFTLEVRNTLETANATNILTPDGDGVNDYWIVKDIDLYPNNEVKIYDRSGRLVYTKKNYDNTWGATLNGSPLGEGTYYYIINYGNNTGIRKGFITIIRRN